jgi:hypothetical protein
MSLQNASKWVFGRKSCVIAVESYVLIGLRAHPSAATNYAFPHGDACDAASSFIRHVRALCKESIATYLFHLCHEALIASKSDDSVCHKHGL